MALNVGTEVGTIISQILEGIENRDVNIARACLDTLLSIIPGSNQSVLKNNILKFITIKSQLPSSAFFRLSTCKILGKIAVHYHIAPFEVKRDILPITQSLCQDCSYEVRAAMCQELPNIAQGLTRENCQASKNLIRNSLLSLLVELSSDENIFVRAAAIDSVVLVISYLDPVTVQNTIVPICKNLCLKSVIASNDDILDDLSYSNMSKVFGPLLDNLQEHLTVEDAEWFLDCYYSITCQNSNSNMVSREFCATTLHTVLKVVLGVLPHEVEKKWYKIYTNMCKDSCSFVRKAVAGCFAAMVKTLGSASKLLLTEFLILLRDRDVEVLEALVPNIAIILEHFLSTGTFSTHTQEQMKQALLQCHSECFKFNNWRLKQKILQQFEILIHCVPSNCIHKHFTPIILSDVLTGKAKPVRSQATKTLLIYLRYCLNERQREHTRKDIYTRLFNSSCCYARQMYIVLCQHALEIFSMRYFMEYFYGPLLVLADDKVSNVRLYLVKLLPLLKKQILMLPMVDLNDELERVIAQIEKKELNKDVLESLENSLLQQDKTVYLTNKNDVIREEKRRIEEENAISHGNITLNIGQKSEIKVPSLETNKNNSYHLSNKFNTNTRFMSFFDQHFYTDAGVILHNSIITNPNIKTENSIADTSLVSTLEMLQVVPSSSKNFLNFDSDIRKNQNIHSYKEKKSMQSPELVLSTENVNLDNLTENQLKDLETVTSNITDDIKVNIKKVAEVNYRPKRASCLFFGEHKIKTGEDIKRRSLNIKMESRIPVACFKPKKQPKNKNVISDTKNTHLS